MSLHCLTVFYLKLLTLKQQRNKLVPHNGMNLIFILRFEGLYSIKYIAKFKTMNHVHKLPQFHVLFMVEKKLTSSNHEIAFILIALDIVYL